MYYIRFNWSLPASGNALLDTRRDRLLLSLLQLLFGAFCVLPLVQCSGDRNAADAYDPEQFAGPHVSRRGGEGSSSLFGPVADGGSLSEGEETLGGTQKQWYPHLGGLTPDAFDPVDQILAVNDIPPSVRAEVESFISTLDVVSLPEDAEQLVSQENSRSTTMSGIDQRRKSAETSNTLQSSLRVTGQTLASVAATAAPWATDQPSLADLDTAARVWQYTAKAALVAAGNRSQQFKEALLLLLSDRYRSTASSLPLAARNVSCPTAAPPPACNACSPYRTADGTCNNLINPLFGSARTALRRFARAAYADGIGEPRTKGVAGRALPSSRRVSLAVVSRRSSLSSRYTHLLMQWGQLIDHDLSLSPSTAGVEGIGLTCCADDLPAGAAGGVQNSSLNDRQGCFNIPVPPKDPSFAGRRCLGFSRSSTVPAIDCQLGQRSPINLLTSYMDASMVYGSSQAAQTNLRSFVGGRLKTQEVPGRRSLLPTNPAALCASQNASNVCFLAGDGRVNQLPALASLHTVLLREHNRLAGRLLALNPHWSDERIFQEARKILAAELQHITYNEFLPIVVGPYLYDAYALRPKNGSAYFAGYNGKVDAAIRAEFSTVAYRFGHSLIRSTFSLNDELHRTVASFELNNNFFSPDLIYNKNITENSVIRGLVKDSMENFDFRMTPQVVEFMFEATQLPNTPLDLASLNIQRGRDQGIPSYVSLRKTFGMSVPSSFEDLKATHDKSIVDSLKSVYEDVRDVDAFVGGIGERPLPGAVLGPLFGRIVATQFALIKRGDRFFYENDCSDVFPTTTCSASGGGGSAGGRPCQFTASQLIQLRKTTLSRLLCDNAHLPRIQTRAFTRNFAYQPCESLPAINLQQWKEAI